MSKKCLSSTTLDNKELEDINWRENFKKIFKSYVDELAKIDGIKSTTECERLSDKFWGTASRSDVQKWYRGTAVPNNDNLIQLSQFSQISIDEYLKGYRFDEKDNDYFDKIEINEETANQLYEINHKIHWTIDNYQTMKKLEIDKDSSNGILKTNKSTKVSPVPLLNITYATVTLSNMLGYCTKNESDTIETLKHLSNILNKLDKWEVTDKAPKLLEKLNDYAIPKSDKYSNLYNAVPKDIGEEIDIVLNSVSNMIRNYILDDFINNKK